MMVHNLYHSKAGPYFRLKGFEEDLMYVLCDRIFDALVADCDMLVDESDYSHTAHSPKELAAKLDVPLYDEDSDDFEDDYYEEKTIDFTAVLRFEKNDICYSTWIIEIPVEVCRRGNNAWKAMNEYFTDVSVTYTKHMCYTCGYRYHEPDDEYPAYYCAQFVDLAREFSFNCTNCCKSCPDCEATRYWVDKYNKYANRNKPLLCEKMFYGVLGLRNYAIKLPKEIIQYIAIIGSR